MRHVFVAIICSVVLCASSGCKKDNKDSSNSFETLFKGQAWSGELKYNVSWTREPFFVQFNSSDNRFTWYEFRGTYTGIYSVDPGKRQIKLTFDLSGNTFTSIVDKDNKLMFFSYGGSYSWIIINAELNTSGSDEITNTSWKGVFDLESGSTIKNVSLEFKPSLTVTLPSGLPTTYARNGSFIKFATAISAGVDEKYFVVLNKNKITGVRIVGPSANPYSTVDLTKQ